MRCWEECVGEEVGNTNISWFTHNVGVLYNGLVIYNDQFLFDV